MVAMGDVGLKHQAESIVATAISEFGGVDVLVNNAAIRPHGPFLKTNETNWQRVMDVNMNGPIWLARATLPHMIENGWGRIINFSGMNAQRGYHGASVVSVSKHFWGLTKAFAVEFGPNGITSNIISRAHSHLTVRTYPRVRNIMTCCSTIHLAGLAVPLILLV